MEKYLSLDAKIKRSENVEKEILDYIESNISPIYKKFDRGHRSNHLYDTLNFSLYLAEVLELDYNKVAIISAFHDIGLVKNREMHNYYSAEILIINYLTKPFLKKFFKEEDIIEMAIAIIEHRSSYKKEKSLLGKVISDSDKYSSFKDLGAIKRSWWFKENLTSLEKKEYVYEHLCKKHSEDSHCKIYFKESKDIYKESINTLNYLTKNKKILFKKIDDLINIGELY